MYQAPLYSPYMPSNQTNPYMQQYAMQQNQRYQQLEQANPHLAVPQTMQPLQSQFQPPETIRGRAVTSIEEAKAVKIDMDGSPYIFTMITPQNKQDRKIYVRYLGLDGNFATDAYAYYPEEIPVAPSPVSALTYADIANVIDASTHDLRTKITELEAKINQGGMSHDGTNVTQHAGSEKSAGKKSDQSNSK